MEGRPATLHNSRNKHTLVYPRIDDILSDKYEIAPMWSTSTIFYMYVGNVYIMAKQSIWKDK